MRVVLLILSVALGCGGSSAESSRSGEWLVQETPESEAEPSAEPEEEEPATATEDAVPTEYEIDGAPVDEAAFTARREALAIDDEPFESAELVNEDDSYGGSEASYHAVDPATGDAWVFVEIDFLSSSQRRSCRLVLRRDPGASEEAGGLEQLEGPVEDDATTTMPVSHVTVVSVAREDGADPPAALSRIVEARLRAFEHCHQGEIRRYPDTAGSLTVSVRINGRGTVAEARAAAETLGRPGVSRCALAVFRRLRFRGVEGIEGPYSIELRFDAGPDTVSRPDPTAVDERPGGLL